MVDFQKAADEDDAAMRRLAETIAYVHDKPLEDVVAALERALTEPVVTPFGAFGP